MPGKVNLLRTTFNQLGTPQKKEFIDRLNAQPSTHKIPEYISFLKECVYIYNAEVQVKASKPVPVTSLAAPRAPIVNKTGTLFCANCGNQINGKLRFCPRCGFQNGGENGQAVTQANPYSNPYLTPYINNVPGLYNPASIGGGSFIDLYRKHFGGALHLTALILCTVGAVVSCLMMGISGLFTLLLFALPIDGGWLMFFSAKSQKPIIKTTGISMIKASCIIELIGLCLISFIGIILIVVSGGVLNMFGVNPAALMIISILLILMFSTYGIVYLLSYLKTLESVKNGVITNKRKALKGVKIFFVMSCITNGLLILGALIIGMAMGALGNAMGYLGALLGFPGGTFIFMYTLFSISLCLGFLLKAIPFYNLNNDLK